MRQLFSCHARPAILAALSRSGRPVVLAVALGTGLSGCAPFPDLTEAESASVETTPYPAITPLDTVLPAPETQLDADEIAALEARAAHLSDIATTQGR